MKRFSKNITDILHRAGWVENRKVKTDKFEKLLSDEGFTIFPCVIEFLAEFGDLRIDNSKAKPPTPENFHFVVSEAAPGQYLYVKKVYTGILGIELCVVGEAANNYMLVMMDKSGRFFSGYDEDFRFIANNTDDAIEALCNSKGWPLVKDIIDKLKP